MSDLLASEVVGADGTRYGKVHDVRCVQDGPLRAGVQARWRVDALLIGAGVVGRRLGYHHGQVEGPWLLRVLMGSLGRNVQTIPIEAVASWDDAARVVVLKPDRAPQRATIDT